MELAVRDGAKLKLKLHEGQSQAWEATQRFVFVIAGTQSGKTSFGPWWLWREIQRCGPGDYLAVTATYDLFKLKMLPEMLSVFCHTLGWGIWRASDRVIESHDGKSRIVLRSATVPGGLESATAKAAWLDECGQDDFRLDSWEATLRRLSLSQGRILGTTTPYNLGWLKQQVYDKWRNGNAEIAVIQFESTMNPSFPKEEFELAKTRLPPWKFDMFYRGSFSHPAGLIYDSFDESVHWIEPFEIPADWPRYIGVDFGSVNTAVVYLAHDEEHDLYYLYHETLEGEKSTQGHVDRVKRTLRGHLLYGAWGGAPGEKQQRMDWRAAGLHITQPPVADVEAGIDRVGAMFRTGQLYLFNNCVLTRDQLGTYSRELDELNQPTEEIKDKKKFHLLDALRYDVAGLKLGAGAPQGVVHATTHTFGRYNKEIEEDLALRRPDKQDPFERWYPAIVGR